MSHKNFLKTVFFLHNITPLLENVPFFDQPYISKKCSLFKIFYSNYYSRQIIFTFFQNIPLHHQKKFRHYATIFLQQAQNSLDKTNCSKPKKLPSSCSSMCPLNLPQKRRVKRGKAVHDFCGSATSARFLRVYFLCRDRSKSIMQIFAFSYHTANLRVVAHKKRNKSQSL